MYIEKMKNGEYREVVNWDSRYYIYDWAKIYDCPTMALAGASILSPQAVQDEWKRIRDDHYIADKWEDGDIVIYNSDRTVKEWIKGELHGILPESNMNNKEESNVRNIRTTTGRT